MPIDRTVNMLFTDECLMSYLQEITVSVIYAEKNTQICYKRNESKQTLKRKGFCFLRFVFIKRMLELIAS